MATVGSLWALFKLAGTICETKRPGEKPEEVSSGKFAEIRH